MKRRTLLFIFVQFIAAVFGGNCPAGLLWHEKNGKCCRPILHCAPGHEVKACTTGEFDVCEPCAKGHSNPFNSSSFEIQACSSKECSSDNMLDKNNKCVCNLISGIYGRMYYHCLDSGKHCPKGTQLNQDGECEPCDTGYYKDWDGYGFCKKEINCRLLNLQYKEYGNAQKPASCKEQQTESEDSDDITRTPERTTSSEQNLVRDVTKKPERLPSISDYPFKSEASKSSSITKKSFFTCNLQIVILALGTLLFISLLVIVYLFVTKHRRSKQAKTSLPLKGSNPVADWCYAKNQRPLPSLPEADQYIPMNVSRHASCSRSITQESFKASKQDVRNDWTYQGQDPDDIVFPLNEQPYVKIEALSFE